MPSPPCFVVRDDLTSIFDDEAPTHNGGERDKRKTFADIPRFYDEEGATTPSRRPSSNQLKLATFVLVYYGHAPQSLLYDTIRASFATMAGGCAFDERMAWWEGIEEEHDMAFLA